MAYIILWLSLSIMCKHIIWAWSDHDTYINRCIFTNTSAVLAHTCWCIPVTIQRLNVQQAEVTWTQSNLMQKQQQKRWHYYMLFKLLFLLRPANYSMWPSHNLSTSCCFSRAWSDIPCYLKSCWHVTLYSSLSQWGSHPKIVALTQNFTSGMWCRSVQMVALPTCCSDNFDYKKKKKIIRNPEIFISHKLWSHWAW